MCKWRFDEAAATDAPAWLGPEDRAEIAAELREVRVAMESGRLGAALQLLKETHLRLLTGFCPGGEGASKPTSVRGPHGVFLASVHQIILERKLTGERAWTLRALGRDIDYLLEACHDG